MRSKIFVSLLATASPVLAIAMRSKPEKALEHVDPSVSKPPILDEIASVAQLEPLRAVRAFFQVEAREFKVYIDETCNMPAAWRESWNNSKQWGLWGNANWATKYGAQGWIPHMIDASPFVTRDWRGVIPVAQCICTPTSLSPA